MNKQNNMDDDNEQELIKLKEKLGIEKNISPNELKTALKELAARKVISDFKIKSEKPGGS